MQPGRVMLLDHEAPLLRRRHLDVAATAPRSFRNRASSGRWTGFSTTRPNLTRSTRCPRGSTTRNQNPSLAVEVPKPQPMPEIVMAPRAYWKGSLKLSLVSCPVALYPASTSAEKTRFHMINKETGNRLKQQMVDAETGDVVESDQKGRGYELKQGQVCRDRKGRAGSRPDREQPHHRHRQLRAEGRDRQALSQSPLLHRARRQGRQSTPSP